MPQQSTDPHRWKYTSSSSEGLHTIISPENSECRETWIFRLNLHSGGSTVLKNDTLELSGVVISGDLKLRMGKEETILRRFDSFYLPAGCEATATAGQDLFLYIGGARYE